MRCISVEIAPGYVVKMCYNKPIALMHSGVAHEAKASVAVGISSNDELLNGLPYSEYSTSLVSIGATDFGQSSQELDGQDDYIYGLASASGNTDLYSSIESASDLIPLSEDIAMVDLNAYSDFL